jgi:hypothetical protein
MSILSEQKLDARILSIGAVAGLIGGIPFGMLMAMMGMMPMIGMLVGAENAFVGVLVHGVISAITGALYALFAVRFSQTWGMPPWPAWFTVSSGGFLARLS